MRLLLDTHALLWWTLDDGRLSASARDAIADAANAVYVSAASAWELAIKAGLGRLSLPAALGPLLADELRLNGFSPLAVSVAHALAVRDLAAHHRDPFDRILIAQARLEELTLVSGDHAMRPYGIPLLW
jgi:PIN domain nuclease of toxin-antitoxin system